MNKLKIFESVILILQVLFLLNVTGCSKKNSEDKSPKITYSTKPVDVVKTDLVSPSDTVIESASDNLSYDKIDVDLSSMSSTMVYATVFQMLIDYENYDGKVIRIKGLYNEFLDKKNKIKTDYVLVLDATSCCAEGIEFVLADSSISFPPQDTPITVTGIYKEYFNPDTPDIQRLHLEKAVMTLD